MLVKVGHGVVIWNLLKHQAWAIQDYCILCATCYYDMDRGTRSVPLFVMLETYSKRIKTFWNVEVSYDRTLYCGLVIVEAWSFYCCGSWDSSSLISLNRGSFNVIVRINWLSKRKFVIICHEKVVEIPLEGSRKLRVQGERTLGAAKALMNAKVEFRIDLVHGETSVVKSPYRLAPLEMQELSEQLRELQDKVLELLRKEKLYAKFTKSEAVKNWEVPTTPSEI
ncbi:hypothetical protein Tco_0260248 [Tanacetum coccineum]